MVQAIQKVRCAIYTRKSTDEGLDKEFNTLEAQRESGENYVRSQSYQGWEALPERYDDGGFSGGNLERPALKRLLEDVKQDKVDMIVVYKIDRLTRSLLDFSKLIEILDQHNCSFVSVTQNFNTLDSMGRLTLNILLSFAQFERELDAERIRDKIAASKKKGMWVGGIIPYGYKVENKKLVIHPSESVVVKEIYDLYIELKSERSVCQKIKEDGYLANNKFRPQLKTISEFKHSKINRILGNPIYAGKVVYKGELYEGKHDAIIDKKTWETVQKIRESNVCGRLNKKATLEKTTPILKGLLECGCCHTSMTRNYSKRKNMIYEYYVSMKAVKEGYKNCELGCVPAGELEKFIISKIQIIFNSVELITKLSDAIHKEDPRFGLTEVAEKLKDPSKFLESLPGEILQQIVKFLISRIILYKDHVTIRLSALGYQLIKKGFVKEIHQSKECPEFMEIDFNLDISRKNGHIRILPPADELPLIDDKLLEGVIKAHAWQNIIDEEGCNAEILSKREQVDRSYMDKILKLNCLAPDIITSIMSGSQPHSLRLRDLTHDKIPLSWKDQREKYGFNSVNQ